MIVEENELQYEEQICLQFFFFGFCFSEY